MICEAASHKGLYLVCTQDCTRLVHVILRQARARCCTLGFARAEATQSSPEATQRQARGSPEHGRGAGLGLDTANRLRFQTTFPTDIIIIRFGVVLGIPWVVRGCTEEPLNSP